MPPDLSDARFAPAMRVVDQLASLLAANGFAVRTKPAGPSSIFVIARPRPTARVWRAANVLVGDGGNGLLPHRCDAVLSFDASGEDIAALVRAIVEGEHAR